VKCVIDQRTLSSVSECRRWERQYSKYDALDWAATALPCLRWLHTYDWQSSLSVRSLQQFCSTAQQHPIGSAPSAQQRQGQQSPTWLHRPKLTSPWASLTSFQQIGRAAHAIPILAFAGGLGCRCFGGHHGGAPEPVVRASRGAAVGVWALWHLCAGVCLCAVRQLTPAGKSIAVSP
jgi:hypothetical protein